MKTFDSSVKAIRKVSTHLTEEPKNIGESLSIDETCLSSGEVYTFLTNKAGMGRKGTLAAVVKGTRQARFANGF